MALRSVTGGPGRGFGWAGVALGLYLAGGLACLAGGLLLVWGRGVSWPGWGDGASLAPLALALGMALSMAGVLLMRLVRNRSRR